ncbi:phosphoprotein phosphatase 2A catalytic subunit PPH21 [Sugiyamaella lignohabitans]|uniref:Phosphoprotein phosphatase 2A catalytic subunit PPH21 n=1 Tax=Sugiyamaella lignohabitans TaxID=796027 RepID=A0A167DBY5_9ASCO|nr:phosphoprotein phosphatase 2A catalytic subunit PPH21 [Sugiyamaella lignohabitans]ANB12736.1 phosphoprotein phosphatase 2A catalytic subunit PPH21 [Sugiyamaella lignohabitans]
MDIDPDVQMEDALTEPSLGLEDEENGHIHEFGVDPLDSRYHDISVMGRNAPAELTSQSLNQLDSWIETLQGCNPLSEEEVQQLCNMVSTTAPTRCRSRSEHNGVWGSAPAAGGETRGNGGVPPAAGALPQTPLCSLRERLGGCEWDTNEGVG